MEKITPDIIKQMIERTADVFCSNEVETEAYKQGAQMMYEFCLMNPQFARSQEAEEFRSMCLFPSVINIKN